MATFGQLRDFVMKEAKVSVGGKGFFEFRCIDLAHDAFWDDMNTVEWQKGYVPGVYEKPDSLALCEMDLLTQEEFDEWVSRFREIHKPLKK